jgi:pilus assembly protein CpaB
MDRKKLVLLLGALIIAIGTAFAARSMFAGGAAPDAEAAAVPTGPRVLVAKRALTAGTIITVDALGFQPWPKELVQDAYFIEGEADMNKLLGTVVRYPITAGEPVTQGSLVAPGDRGFLAAALGPGMRAVTVPVSAMTGVAGFVFPGDRVDLVLTQEIDGADDSSLKTAETVLRNLRVLATDQTVEKTTDENGKTVVTEFRTVTLEVTPKIAEKVAVAQTIGTISLVLRSLADSPADLERAVAAGDVQIPANATPEQEDKMLKAAMGRPIDKGTTFVTGGDVSRFQRTTVPPKTSRNQPQYSAPAPSVRSTGGDSAPAPTGPSVRVTRGKETTDTPVSAKANAGAILTSQSGGLRRTGQVLPSAGATVIK